MALNVGKPRVRRYWMAAQGRTMANFHGKRVVECFICRVAVFFMQENISNMFHLFFVILSSMTVAYL